MLLVLDTIDLRGKTLSDYRAAVPRAAFDVEAAVTTVRPIVAAVAERGIDALAEYSERFDHVVPEHFAVPEAELLKALTELDPAVRSAFAEAVARRAAVAEAEAQVPQVRVELAEGAVVEQRTIPVQRVGLYVPGGLAPLASSVLMNVIPAQKAGVESIAIASPPQAEFGGLPHPNILAMCALLGVNEVYAVGGAQAIAMFAYGVAGLCPSVNVITGPGNIYVVAAKRLLRGVVGIDAEAGPTEIAILADDSANPAFVAADLLSQAEHDPMASSVLVTDSQDLAAAVKTALLDQVAVTKHRERIATALDGSQSAVVLVDDLEQGLAVVNAYAAEHLEIQTRNACELAARVRNAGAIFIGGYSPVSLGDYLAGSTHVLPTGGAAAHSSGLHVGSFRRQVHVVEYSAAALAAVAQKVEDFASAEDLPGHRAAISVRRQS